MGERTPHLDPNARGAFFGLSSRHTRSHMLRAVMEGVAFSLRDCVEIIRTVGLAPKDMLVCGGGGRSAFWRQMLADLTGIPVATPTNSEGPALGVAILAGVACGTFGSVEEGCDAVIRANPPEQPDSVAGNAYEPFYRVFTELYPALKGGFGKLAGL
jgi:xylulokinase